MSETNELGCYIYWETFCASLRKSSPYIMGSLIHSHSHSFQTRSLSPYFSFFFSPFLSARKLNSRSLTPESLSLNMKHLSSDVYSLFDPSSSFPPSISVQFLFTLFLSFYISLPSFSLPSSLSFYSSSFTHNFHVISFTAHLRCKMSFETFKLAIHSSYNSKRVNKRV